MQNDPELRNVTEETTGDFIQFELFNAGQRHIFHITGTTLQILKNGKEMTRRDSFDQNIELIKSAAFSKRKVDGDFTILDSDDFK